MLYLIKHSSPSLFIVITNSCDWHIFNPTVLAKHSPVVGSPVVLSLDCKNPCWWNFYSTVPGNIAWVNCLFDPGCVSMSVKIWYFQAKQNSLWNKTVFESNGNNVFSHVAFHCVFHYKCWRALNDLVDLLQKDLVSLLQICSLIF